MSNDEQPVSDEQRAAEDEATFGMEGAATKGEVSVEVSRANSRKMMKVWLAVGAISVLATLCIATGILGLILYQSSQEPVVEDPAKKKLPPAKEMKAKIKSIDKNGRTIRLLVGDGKYQTFHVTAETEFRDDSGQRLPEGLDSAAVREEELVTILTTEDRQGLRWLKLGSAK